MSTLQIVFFCLAIGMMLSWLLLALRGPRKIDEPNVIAILRHGPQLRTLALILALAPPMMMAFVMWAFLWKSTTTVLIGGGSFFAIGMMAGLLLLETDGSQLVLTEEGITRYTVWSKPRTLAWRDVQRVRYSSVNRWFVVSGPSSTIRVSRYLIGIDKFAETVKRKVAAERRSSADEALNALP